MTTRVPTVSTLVTIAQGLDVDPRELLVLAGYVPEDMARARRQVTEESIARVAESAILSISRTVAATLNPGTSDNDNSLQIDRPLLAETAARASAPGLLVGA